jgi:hypothetical protein
MFAYIASGGSGLNVSPGPCISSGFITSTDPDATVGPWTDVDVISQGPARGDTIDGERGANDPVSFHGLPPKKGTAQSFSISVHPGS